jgi:hypothetical protein
MHPNCKCGTPPFYYADFSTTEVGEDASGAEISLETCKSCGQMWIKYLIEEPHLSRSGRWWRVQVSPEQRHKISPAHVKEFIEEQPWCFVGGSFFESTGKKVIAPIHVV